MKTCKRCKWWNINFDNDCDFINTIQAANKSTRFEVKLVESYDCTSEIVLKTGPDFGCIHFESLSMEDRQT